jgi:hypothetical protein
MALFDVDLVFIHHLHSKTLQKHIHHLRFFWGLQEEFRLYQNSLTWAGSDCYVTRIAANQMRRISYPQAAERRKG